MKLQDTIELMNSKDFKDRVRAEYYQLKIRHEGLARMLKKIQRRNFRIYSKLWLWFITHSASIYGMLYECIRRES